MKILTSASKLVFLLLAITACIAFFFGKLESKDFMLLAVSAFTFYFSNKGETPTNTTTTTTATTDTKSVGSDLPFLGK